MGEWRGLVKCKTASVHDHNFSKHPQHEDFFHVKITLKNKYFFSVLFCCNLTSKEDLQKKLPHNLTGFLKK